MKLSDGEKLIAIMLADIMEASQIDSEVNPTFVKEAVTSGHLWALKWEYPGIFESDDDSPEVVKETADILDMCRVVEGSINHLDDAERATITDNDREVFFGFDGNHEAHYGVARMFVKEMGRWEEFKNRNLNSHMPSLDLYRRMKKVYDQSPRTTDGGLSLSDIKKIIEAQRP